jgi:opacity protein-like surface antigen
MKKLLIATSVALALSATSAFAVTQKSGVYGTVLGGWSFANAPSASNAGATSSTNRNYTWGGNLGYQYAFTQNWAAGLEIGYVSFGQTNYSGTNSGNIQNTGAQAMAVGSYMMNNGFNAFVKAGAIDEYSKTSPSSGGPNVPLTSGNTKIAKWEPAAAVGVGYMPMQNLNVAVQYEYTWGANWNTSGNNNSVNKPMTQNAVTLNLTYLIPLSF